MYIISQTVFNVSRIKTFKMGVKFSENFYIVVTYKTGLHKSVSKVSTLYPTP